MKIDRVNIITKYITSKILRAINQTHQLENNDVMYKQERMISAEEVARVYGF